ncbi:ABC transporter substrate-binding protein [Pseudolabrys taiwanensis]|uniref:ABC transporter substrate-binding protein n=1 Tax=Pseudolabrys taiwanensis TaxID=331696 RepID=A0A346A2G6_9HYPH|nr:ABC transporter substrate-binding protein [Pseudolabrys taiwanensis]AXK83363.1 ABC transporter substrate-binding protein [Pseudolabrys taiwanensis]
MRLLGIAAGIVAAVLSGAGCASAQTPLKIGVVSRTIFYLPAWIAAEQGFFKAEGIDPSIEVYNDAHKIFTDLKAGTIQIGISSIESVVQDGYKGGSMRLIAGTAQRPPHYIIAQPEIKTLADLKGKTIGVVSMHEGTTFFVKDIARKGGFAVADVKVEAVGGSPARARLLKERKIDAGLQPYPLSYEAEADGFSNLGPIADLVPDYQFTSVMVDNMWAATNRDLVVRFLRALRKGTDYMFAHPDASATLGAKELRTSPANAKRALEDTARMDVMARDLSLTDLSLRRVFATMQEAEVMGRDSSYDRGKFVDDSYLNDSRR